MIVVDLGELNVQTDEQSTAGSGDFSHSVRGISHLCREFAVIIGTL